MAVLLRVVVLRSSEKLRYGHVALLGRRGLAPTHPRPPFPQPSRWAAPEAGPRGPWGAGSYPVTARWRRMRTHRSSVGRGRSSGGVRSGRRAACSCSFRGGSCLAARRIISRMLILFSPNRFFSLERCFFRIPVCIVQVVGHNVLPEPVGPAAGCSFKGIRHGRCNHRHGLQRGRGCAAIAWQLLRCSN